MKLALLGDIHGNAAALSAVLLAADAQGVEHLLITGDLVGYYFEPATVLRLLERYSTHIVRGNHEDMLTEARANPAILENIRDRYGSGIDVALAQLDPKQLDWLDALPHPLSLDFEGRRILLSHGCPWDVDQYVYPDASELLLQRCADSAFDFVVMGHTHYPMVRRFGNTTLVNPGSVGQPRNREPGAQWALLDTATGEVELCRENYDWAPLAAESALRHPEIPYLSEVLGRSK